VPEYQPYRIVDPLQRIDKSQLESIVDRVKQGQGLLKGLFRLVKLCGDVKVMAELR